MPKILIALVLLGTLGSAQELTANQANKLQNYQHSASGKIRHKRLLQQTAMIKKGEAYALAEKACKAEPYALKLLLHGNRLFYWIKTDKGNMKIDALDAQIIQACER